MALVRMWLRRLRAERTAPLALALIVLVSAFAAAAAAGTLDRTANEALRGEVRAATPGTPNIELIEERRIAPGTSDTLANVTIRGDEHAARIPPGLRSLVTQRHHIADTPFWSVRSETPLPSTVALRIQQDVAGHIRLIDGRMPTGATRTESFAEAAGASVPVLEAALATGSAEALGAGIGDVLVMVPDPYDPLADQEVAPIAIDIVGTFTATDTADAYWSGDTELTQPWIRSIADDIEFLAARALLAPEVYPALLDATVHAPSPQPLFGAPEAMPMRYRWRSIVDPERIEADASDALVADLRRMEGLFPASATSVPLRGILLRSSLLNLIDAQRARWRSAETVLAVVGVGVLAVGAAAVLLVATLGVQRRSQAIATWAARGASTPQLVVGTLAEGLMMTLPSAVLGALAAAVLVPGAGGPGVLLAALVAVATTLAVLVAVVRSAAASRASGRAIRVVRGASPRRLVIEAVLVVLAVGAALLLRERGVAGSADIGAADALLAAVPALVGAAAGIVALRTLPLPVRLLAGAAQLRRDLVPILGLQRARREGSTATMLIVLLAGSMLATFSLATLVYLDRAAGAVAWQTVGAPYRVTRSVGAVPALAATELPGVESAARLYRTTVATRGVSPFELLAIDAAAFRAVSEGTPAAAELPEALLSGGYASPLPAIVSTAVAETGGTGLGIGDTFGVVIRGRTVSVQAVDVRDTFPTLPVEGRFAIISLPQLEALAPDLSVPTSTLLLRAPDGEDAALRQAIAAEGRGLRLESRVEREEAFRSSPVMSALVTMITTGLALTAAFAALAVAAALAVTGAVRADEMTHLRTLGVSRAQAVGLVMAEHGTTMLIGFVAGGFLGAWLFGVLRPGLGLTALVGSPLQVPFALDAGHVALMVAAFLATATVGIGLSAALERAASSPEVIRRGLE